MGEAAPARQTALVNTDDEIVYLTPTGVIKVYDPYQSTNTTAVEWYSPTGGWTGIALGDFNNDGDAEIAAIGVQNGVNTLAVFDPVVTSPPIVPGQLINGIYWNLLYQMTLPGQPLLVGTGDFNTAEPGQEIVVSYRPPNADSSNTIILTQTAPNPDGRAWSTLATLNGRPLWTTLATGQLDYASDTDELVLISNALSEMSIYRLIGGQIQRIWVNQSNTRVWRSAAIGRVDPSTVQNELASVRTAPPPLPTLLVSHLNTKGGLDDIYTGSFLPAPQVVFLADVNGSGDQEVFMLRSVPASLTAVPQLFMRQMGNDPAITFEVRLDTTNSFQGGASGDLYGTGKDQVIVTSPSQLRIFQSPATSTTDIVNVSVNSDGHTIVTGNLDGAGYLKPDTLAVNPTHLAAFDVAAGAVSGIQQVFVSNSTNPSSPIGYYVYTSPHVDFVDWTLSNSQTPAGINIRVDASQLAPEGLWATNLVVQANGSTVLDPRQVIPVVANVQPGVYFMPARAAVFAPAPCRRPAPLQSLTLNVLGTPGSTFTAQIQPVAAGADIAQGAAPAIDWPSSVPWVTAASSLTNTVPASITLTIDPNQAPDLAAAQVTLSAVLSDAVGGGAIQRVAAITFICPQTVTYLPTVFR